MYASRSVNMTWTKAGATSWSWAYDGCVHTNGGVYDDDVIKIMCARASANPTGVIVLGEKTLQTIQ
jgi:hypothetical protein